MTMVIKSSLYNYIPRREIEGKRIFDFDKFLHSKIEFWVYIITITTVVSLPLEM